MVMNGLIVWSIKLRTLYNTWKQFNLIVNEYKMLIGTFASSNLIIDNNFT